MKAAIPQATSQVALLTIGQYLASRSAALRLNPETEGKRVYQMVLVMVLDNGFSLQAKQSFPLVRRHFGIRNLTEWARDLRTWLAGLSRSDRKLFYGLQFVP